MEKHHKFSIWYVLLGIWVVLIIHNLLFSMFAIETIPYSEFLDRIQRGEVAEVAITQNQIQGKTTPGQEGEKNSSARSGWTRKFPNCWPKNNITFKGEIESTFFRDLLSWVVPIFLFVDSGFLSCAG